jgi:adenylate cyclase
MVSRGDRRPRISTAALLALSFGTLVLLSVGGVLALTVGANYRNTFDLLGARSVLLIEAIEDALRAHLGRAEAAVDGVAELYATGRFEIDDNAAMTPALLGSLASVPGATGMLVYTDDLKVRGVVRDAAAPAGRFRVLDPAPEKSPDVRAALQMQNRSPSARWGPFVTVEGVVYANVSAALTRGGVRRGWVVAPVELGILSALTRDLSARFGTHAFILDRTDRVLADGRLADPAARGDGVRPLETLAAFGDPVLARFAAREPIEAFDASKAKDVEITEIELAEQDRTGGRGRGIYIAITKSVAGYGPHPWTLGAYFRRAEVGDEIRRTWTSGAIGIAALALSLAAAILLGRKLARPVAAFSALAREVAEFRLDAVSEMPRSRVIEFDQQAVAFNGMIAGLRAFATYVPRSLVARLVKAGDADAARLREATVTVMFTDISGFTSLSETMSAGDVAELLNHHFSILCRAVDDHGGTVDKFLGDGMMAFFGAPDHLEAHGAAAVRAAAAIRDALDEDHSDAAGGPRARLRIRVGIHTGRVFVGNIGASDRVNYTIVGDAVNVSQRLQELGRTVAPDAETVILVSAATVSGADLDFDMDCVGDHVLRGREEKITVYRLGARKTKPA